MWLCELQEQAGNKAAQPQCKLPTTRAKSITLSSNTPATTAAQTPHTARNLHHAQPLSRPVQLPSTAKREPGAAAPGRPYRVASYNLRIITAPAPGRHSPTSPVDERTRAPVKAEVATQKARGARGTGWPEHRCATGTSQPKRHCCPQLVTRCAEVHVGVRRRMREASEGRAASEALPQRPCRPHLGGHAAAQAGGDVPQERPQECALGD